MGKSIAEVFSAVAASYDAHAVAQRMAAQALLAFTGGVAPRTILELGCGTGLYTRMLRAAFPTAEILGIDIAEAMVDVARRHLPDVAFRVTDAEWFSDGHYELVTANATVQWFTNWPGSIARLVERLTPGGTLSFSFFGPETYRELDTAVRTVFGEAACVTSRRFERKEALSAELSASCRSWTLEERRFTQTFPSLRSLLLAIRQTGTRGPGLPVALTPNRLARIEAAYLARESGICASYQVFLCKGQR